MYLSSGTCFASLTSLYIVAVDKKVDKLSHLEFMTSSVPQIM